jgi:cytosine/adenosine deaminase-related metal-dependent hydrolase
VRLGFALLFASATLTGFFACSAEETNDDGSSGQGGAATTTTGVTSAGGAMSSSGGTGGMGTTVGSGGFPGTAGPDAELIANGDPDKLLLRGTIITPDEKFAGELLIVGDTIACVDTSCATHPDVGSASVVQTNGVIMPGMIDTHNHILFGIFDETDWSPSQAYGNHNQWPNEPRYSAMIDTKQYINGEAGSPVNLNCELNKYGELKGLVAGTTSILGAANPGNKVCYRTGARTIDQSANGLCGTDPPQSCPDKIQAHTLFPSSSSADGVCTNFGDGDTEAYVVHVGEGVDASALSEWDDLKSAASGCLIDARTAVVHGTAFTDTEFTELAAAGMGLVWSPASNVFLYGLGTDLTKTTDIPLVLSKGITVSLAPDWSMGGSQNLLDELRFADEVDNQQWADLLTAKELVQMVTTNAAELLGLSGQIGVLEVGAKADVTVFGGDIDLPYKALLTVTPYEIRLVVVDGRVTYGDDQLASLGPSSPGCETLDICGRSKFLCLAIDGGDASNKFGQSLTDIQTALNTELSAYDAMNVTQWDFAPITPLVKCP